MSLLFTICTHKYVYIAIVKSFILHSLISTAMTAKLRYVSSTTFFFFCCFFGGGVCLFVVFFQRSVQKTFTLWRVGSIKFHCNVLFAIPSFRSNVYIRNMIFIWIMLLICKCHSYNAIVFYFIY